MKGLILLSFYLPLPQRPPFTVEVDSHFHHRQSAQGEAFGIIFQVNLLHGGIGGFIQFQFYDVEGAMGAQHHIHTSAGSAYFHVHVEAEKAEDDIEQGLIMPLIVRVVALRNGREEGQEQLQGLVHVAAVNGIEQIGCQRGGTVSLGGWHIVGQQTFHQPQTHLFVGDVERVQAQTGVLVLDGDVSTLVE